MPTATPGTATAGSTRIFCTVPAEIENEGGPADGDSPWQNAVLGLKPVLLVHGAWHGAWCWDPAMAELGRRGVASRRRRSSRTRIRPRAAHRPRRGRRTGSGGPLISSTSPWSWSGIPTAVSSSPRRVCVPTCAALVYLASFNLDQNESAMSVAMDESARAAIDYSDRPDALQAHAHAVGTSTIDVAGAHTLFYNDFPRPELAQWAASRLGRHPMASLSEIPDAVAWRHRPSTYAVCARDNTSTPNCSAF